MTNTVPAALLAQPLWIEQNSFALQANVSTSFTKVAFIPSAIAVLIPLVSSFRIRIV